MNLPHRFYYPQTRLMDKQEIRSKAQWNSQKPWMDHFDKPGTTPGTLVIKNSAAIPKLILIDYDATTAIRRQLNSPEECTPYLDSNSVSWIDVQGLGSENMLQELGKVFQLHPLLLEDIVNVPQRPKVEQYQDQLVIVTRMVTCGENSKDYFSEQVSLILGKHYLLTVQEEERYDTFSGVRDRIKTAKGIIRNQGPDYLAYALIDTIVDEFFPILEALGERLEELEVELAIKPSQRTLDRIHYIKRDLLNLRRLIWPLRDVINVLIRDPEDLVTSEVKIYLRDCYDHIIQAVDIVENYRELASSLMDLYLSSVGNRMNGIMKVLTVISTIFIPLTFIAGVYGMNFNPDSSPVNMPELNWYWGYPTCLTVMLMVAITLILLFRNKGWFENL